MVKIKNAGFTMLELLVVIAIAGMILSFVMVNIRDARMKSRDSRREEDIKQFQNALSIYATNRNVYPICPSEVVVSGASDNCVGPIFVSEGVFQGGRVPTDPIGVTSGTCGTAGNYVYCYQSSGYTYTIRYALEGSSILGKTAGWQTVGP